MEPQFLRTHMHINIHPIERIIRILVGSFLVMYGFSQPGGERYLYLAFSYFVLTGLIGFDIVYYFLSFNTNRWARVKHSRDPK